MLDTPAEAGFDDLARLAALICATPIALVCLVDRDRQWFKSRIGIADSETPRDQAFCAHAILAPAVMLVADAQLDERFCDNPLVTGEPHIRFYAGAPLEMANGQRIGTLCVMDRTPRGLDASQQEALAALARQVVAQIELRGKVTALREASVRQVMFELQLQRFNDEMMALVALQTDELRAERDRAELYFDVAGSMMVVADARGRIELANRMTAEVLGYPGASLPGQDWFDLCFPAEERAEARRFFQGLVDGELDGDRRFRGRVITADGQPRTIAWHTTRLTDERGAIRGLLGVGEDITSRLEAEEHLRQTLEELERSNMALQQFVHVASHDLREPINSILNFAKLLARDRKDADEARIDRYVEFVLRGGQRLRTLVDDLLAYVHIENTEACMESVELDDAVEETRQSLADAIEKSGAMLSSEKLPVIRGDRTLIGLLLQNLVSNAIKFRRPGERPAVGITATQDAERLLIHVTDNGIGVPLEYRERIFGAFQRLHARSDYEGSGLGLALCRRIADMHGARLSVQSGTDGGSCFVLALPLASVLRTAPTETGEART